MYDNYKEEEAREKYIGVCILLAIIGLINIGVSIWEICQVNRLQMQQGKMKTIQTNYENSEENTKDSIGILIDELNNIKNESVNMIIGIVVSSVAGIFSTSLMWIPKELLRGAFADVRDSRYYSDTIEKIIVIESCLVGISFVFELYAILSSATEYIEFFKLYEKVFLILESAILMAPSF